MIERIRRPPGRRPVQIQRARALRRNETDVERKLWHALRGRQVVQLKFRRQVPIGPYVVDFVCVGKMLVVELDGGQHAIRRDHDAIRTRALEARGYRIVRFWNHEVVENIDGVLAQISEMADR
jgi:very-short-patch-repair endonuclease